MNDRSLRLLCAAVLLAALAFAFRTASAQTLRVSNLLTPNKDARSVVVTILAPPGPFVWTVSVNGKLAYADTTQNATIRIVQKQIAAGDRLRIAVRPMGATDSLYRSVALSVPPFQVDQVTCRNGKIVNAKTGAVYRDVLAGGITMPCGAMP